MFGGRIASIESPASPAGNSFRKLDFKLKDDEQQVCIPVAEELIVTN